MAARALSLFVALDVFLLALFTLGGSKRGETISAAAWSLECDGKWQGRVFRPVIDFCAWYDPEHCRSSWIVAMKIHHALES